MGHGQGGLPYILDDPEGNPRVIKSARLIFDRHQKYEDLGRLGSRLKPAAGWKFRTVVRIGKLPVNARCEYNPEAGPLIGRLTGWVRPSWARHQPDETQHTAEEPTA